MEPQPPTALDITTLVVAICAAVVAATALGWQIASWLLSGGRAKVELLNGALHQFGPQWIVMPPNKPLDPSGTANGFTRRAIFVEVRNVGRLPVTVTSWQLKLPGGVKIGELNSPNGPRLPHRLDVGDSEKWAIEVDSELVAALLTTRKMAKVDDVEVRAVVSLGSGKEIKAPQRITFTAKELKKG